MGLNNSLKDTPLTDLIEMFSEITQKLVESQVNNDMEMVATYQKTLETIQEALIIKRSENLPLK